MQITKTTEEKLLMNREPAKPTDVEMQNEYDYLLAEQITGNLLKSGMITDTEYHRIMVENRKSFSPKISKLID